MIAQSLIGSNLPSGKSPGVSAGLVGFGLVSEIRVPLAVLLLLSCLGYLHF